MEKAEHYFNDSKLKNYMCIVYLAIVLINACAY